jgi:MFS family permease
MAQLEDRLDGRGRRALAGLALAMLMPSLDTSIANVGLPVLSERFSASLPRVQWVVLSYLVVVTLLVAVMGRLGDRVGHRRLLLAGIGLFTLASALCGLAPSLGLLVAARAAQGVGAAAVMALVPALVAGRLAAARTGRAMGFLGSVSAVGTSLGPCVGGALIAGFGWRSMFLVNVPVGLIALLLAGRSLAPDPAPVKGPSGGGGGALARLVESLRDPTLRDGLAGSLLVSAVMMSTLLVGPFYLSIGLGLDPVRTGLAMAAGPVVAALCGVPAGRLVDRWGGGAAVALGLAAIASGLLALAAQPAFCGIAGYVAAIIVVTAGYALFQAANGTLLLRSAAADRRGLASGLLGLSRNIGLLAGAGLMGWVFALAAGTSDMSAAAPSAVAAGMHATYAVAAVLVLAALTLRGAGKIRPARWSTAAT